MGDFIDNEALAASISWWRTKDQRIAELEAELAALKARHCETCRYRKSERDEAYNNYAFHRHVCDCEESVCFECELDDGSPFSCNRWAAREHP
jgi:hypothetical protein